VELYLIGAIETPKPLFTIINISSNKKDPLTYFVSSKVGDKLINGNRNEICPPCVCPARNKL